MKLQGLTKRARMVWAYRQQTILYICSRHKLLLLLGSKRIAQWLEGHLQQQKLWHMMIKIGFLVFLIN